MPIQIGWSTCPLTKGLALQILGTVAQPGIALMTPSTARKISSPQERTGRLIYNENNMTSIPLSL